MAATRSSRDAGGRAASRPTSTAGSIQPPVWVGRSDPTERIDRPPAASATSRARADRKAPAPGSDDGLAASGVDELAGRPGQEDGRDVGPAGRSRVNGELSRRARMVRARLAIVAVRRDTPVRPVAGKPADRVQDPLDVVGGLAGLEHRNGDVDEGLDRRQRLDRPGGIDGRRPRLARPHGGARRGTAADGVAGLGQRAIAADPSPRRASRAVGGRSLRRGHVRQPVGDGPRDGVVRPAGRACRRGRSPPAGPPETGWPGRRSRRSRLVGRRPAIRLRPVPPGPARPSPSRPNPRRGRVRSGRGARPAAAGHSAEIRASAATANETVGPTRLRSRRR